MFDTDEHSSLLYLFVGDKEKKFYNISGDQNNWIEGPVHLENDEPLIFAAAAGDYLVRPFQGDQIGRFFANWATFGSSKI
jgi:hypothetical protein